MPPIIALPQSNFKGDDDDDAYSILYRCTIYVAYRWLVSDFSFLFLKRYNKYKSHQIRVPFKKKKKKGKETAEKKKRSF